MAMNENEEFEFRLRAEQEAAQQRAIPKPQDSQAALKEVIAEQGFLGRNAASLGAAPVKLYLGVKQLMNGGKLSPEDQQLKKDWDTIEEGGTTGAITGNVATMLLPGGAMAKAGQAAGLPALVRVGQAITNPQSLKAATAVGAGYGALQPTTEQGGAGLVHRGINGTLGAAGGAAGYGFATGLARLISPKAAPAIADKVDDIAAPVYAAGVSPEEVARIEALKRLPVPITEDDIIRSQVTRLYPQQEAERLIAGQHPVIGGDLAARLARGQEKMSENLDVLPELTRAGEGSGMASGEKIRGWLQGVYQAAKNDTNNAYKYAKELHGNTVVSPSDDLVQTLAGKQDMPGYSQLFAQAKRMGIITEGENGIQAGSVPVSKLDEFKVIANTLTGSSDGMTRHAGGDVVGKIYSQLDEIAPEFKQAAAFRLRQGRMFETPTITQKILGTTDGKLGAAETEVGGLTIPNYKVADEKLADTVMRGSNRDLKYIRDLALNGTKEQRTEGVQAIREMRGEVLAGMREVWDKTQTPLAKANQLEKYLDKLGEEKIQILFGKAGAKKIEAFREAAQIMNKGVPSPEGGSQTAGRLMNMASGTFNALERLPLVGPYVGAPLVKGAQAIGSIGTASKAKNIPMPLNPERLKAADALRRIAPYTAIMGASAGADY